MLAVSRREGPGRWRYASRWAAGALAAGRTAANVAAVATATMTRPAIRTSRRGRGMTLSPQVGGRREYMGPQQSGERKRVRTGNTPFVMKSIESCDGAGRAGDLLAEVGRFQQLDVRGE